MERKQEILKIMQDLKMLDKTVRIDIHKGCLDIEWNHYKYLNEIIVIDYIWEQLFNEYKTKHTYKGFEIWIKAKSGIDLIKKFTNIDTFDLYK